MTGAVARGVTRLYAPGEFEAPRKAASEMSNPELQRAARVDPYYRGYCDGSREAGFWTLRLSRPLTFACAARLVALGAGFGAFGLLALLVAMGRLQ